MSSLKFKKWLQKKPVTLVIMFITFVSRLLGFFRSALVAYYFGGQGVADVLNMAFVIPNNLRKLLAEGSLSSAFIPTLTHVLHQENGAARAKILVRTLLSAQVMVCFVLILLFYMGGGTLIHWISPFENEHKFALMVQISRLYIFYLLFVSLAATFMAVLNTHNQFIVAAVAPLVFSISTISSMVLLHKPLGAYSMVYGVLVGGALYMLFMVPSFYKKKYSLWPSFHFNNSDFKLLMKQFWPVACSAIVFIVNQQVSFRFASELPNGSVSALSNALVLWQLPMGIFAASVTTVYFPKISHFVVHKQGHQISFLVEKAIILMVFFLLATVGYYCIWYKHLIAFVFQRGMFHYQNTLMTAPVLLAYSLGILSVGLFNLLLRILYGMQKFIWGFLYALVTVIIDILFSYYLKNILGISGLAWANTIVYSGMVCIGMGLVLIKLNHFDYYRFSVQIFKITLAVFICFFISYGLRQYFPISLSQVNQWLLLVYLIIVSLFYVFLYGIVLKILNFPINRIFQTQAIL